MDKREILRYLGAAPEETGLDGLIDRAWNEIRAAASPRHISRRLAIEVGERTVVLPGAQFESRTLAAHLSGCREAFLFAFTLGPGVDALIRRCELTEMPLVPVLQACAAAYTEERADKAQEELGTAAAAEGLYLRPRYSPGYGDFSLKAQKYFFSSMDISKRIGVSLTDACLMVPMKSITAIIGLSSDPSLCHVGKCMTCNAEKCPFRKEA